MQAIRQKLKRGLSYKDKDPNFDEHEDFDEETTGHLHKDLEEAESNNHPEGRPGSFLNRLISYGNKKTEDQIAAETAASKKASGGAQQRPASLQPDATTAPKPASTAGTS